MAEELRLMFPGMTSITLEAKNYETDRSTELSVHGIKTYAESTEFFRSLGIGQRKKTIYADTGIGAYTHISGCLGEVRVVTYPNELPPSCHIEKVIERVPKTQTVDTGQFIEIERQKVVCSHEPDEVVA